MAVKIVCDFYDLQEAVRALAGGEMEASHLRGRIEELDRNLSKKDEEIHSLKMELRAANTPRPNPSYAPLIEGLIRAVSSGQKIGAIKEVRTLLGLGLKEAKDLVEAQTGKPYHF